MINLGKMPKVVKVLHQHAGKRQKPIYKYVYNEKYGCPRRVQTGVVDQDAFIQESADSVDFKAIGQMLVDTRDNVVSHFSCVEGETIDITGQPRNIHEYAELQTKIKSSFESYPEELKSLFGSFDGFSRAYRNGSVGQVIDSYYKSLQKQESATEGGAE